MRPTYCADSGRAPGRRETAHVTRRSASSSLLAIDESRVGARVVLAVRGEVDISNADDLRQALESARAAGVGEIWLDLTATTFLDCRGVRALLDLRGHLVVICPPGPVRRLLALTGADRELEIHSTPAAAARPWRSAIARRS